jgi:hypothetical protein
MTVEHIIRLAEAYASHQGLSLSTVSSYAANDGKLFPRMKKGAGCTVRRATALVAWFDTNWAVDLEWPSDIPRPSSKASKSRRVA